MNIVTTRYPELMALQRKASLTALIELDYEPVFKQVSRFKS